MKIEELYQYYQECKQRVSTDSRKITDSCLYFALKGENFDGNNFALDALHKGAKYAVVDNPSIAKQDERLLLVEDVLISLQQLATHHRRTFHIPIIGITGSNGKTTTKELIAHVLKSHYETHFTQGNYNNHIGVPLTLLAMPKRTEVAIIEMGANHQGEIEQLSEIAEPTHGIITNIGKAHLEGFGGIEGVKKGKSELYRFLAKTKGIAFINRNQPFLDELSASVRNRIFYLQSRKPTLIEPDYEIVLLKTAPHLKVSFLDKDSTLVEANTHLYGMHNFQNLMASVCIGKYFKVPTGKIKFALEHYIPSDNRSQQLTWGPHQVILDAYNANPSSMEQALIHFDDLDTKLPKVLLLGDMLELGEVTQEEHLKVAKRANAIKGNKKVILIGPYFKNAAENLSLTHFNSVQDLSKWYKQQETWPASCILIKGSRGIRMESFLKD